MDDCIPSLVYAVLSERVIRTCTGGAAAYASSLME
jgi:hypothetical protein